MPTKTTALARTAIGIGVPIGAGAVGGILIAWLKTRYGLSPYWFVALATGFALLVMGSAAWSLTRPRNPMFVFDWVVSFEGTLGFTLLSLIGLVVLASRLLRGTAFVLVTVALVGIAIAILILVFNHAPPTWDDDAAL